MNTPLTLLNGLSPSTFLAEYWQKKPLLIRQAIPDFSGLLTPNELAGLACEDTVQSRIVQKENETWHLKNGPFDESDLTSLPSQNWSLLVQSINHHLPEAAALLSQFNFIPHVRLDDLMVSYAPTGGSVGAHLDSYDVFLLQGRGKRRWKINTTPDVTLIEGAPLKILKHFEAAQEWVLAPGDMLYLPPNVAHHGISEDDDCMTYSIGFRAPTAQELIQGFLEHLQDTIQAEGLYEDADLRLQQHPAEISDAMIQQVSTMLQNIAWDNNTVSDFLGRYMTEPKPDVIFEPTVEAVSIQDFTQQISNASLVLNLQSQLLFHQDHFYMNGEHLAVPTSIANDVRHLADHRMLDTTALDQAQQTLVAKTLYAALLAGYLHVE